MKLQSLCFIAICLLLSACSETNTTQEQAKESPKTSVQKKEKTPEKSLSIPYVYWWSFSGPFAGMCGEAYSLVVSGTVTSLGTAEEQDRFTAQNATVRIHEKLYSKATANQNFSDETFISSSGFYNTGVQLGDKVLLFIFEYEGDYAFPGNKSVLKIDAFDNAAVSSIKKYIAAKQDPLAIKEDVKLWERYNLGTDLQTNIDCRSE